MSHLPVSIVGAGISGLVLGQCLLSHGIHAVIFDKARSSAHRNNHAITLHPRAYQPLLQVLGLDETTFKQRVAVDAEAEVDGQGQLSSDNSAPDLSFRANRRRFEQLLAQHLDISWEHQVDAVTLASTSLHRAASLSVRNGGTHPSSVIVGADEPHSQVRAAITPTESQEVEPLRILPFAAYNGRRLLSHDRYDASLGPFMAHTTVLEQRIADCFLQLSISDRTKDGVLVSYTYSRPARAGDEHDPLYRPRRSKEGAQDIPDAFIAELASLADQLDEPFRAVFDGDAMRHDRLLNWLMRAAPRPLACDADWCEEAAARGGVVLLGDAVHAEPILGGEGANVAIEDGMRLADVLVGGEEPRNLMGFYDARRDVWERSVRESERRLAGLHCANN